MKYFRVVLKPQKQRRVHAVTDSHICSLVVHWIQLQEVRWISELSVPVQLRWYISVDYVEGIYLQLANKLLKLTRVPDLLSGNKESCRRSFLSATALNCREHIVDVFSTEIFASDTSWVVHHIVHGIAVDFPHCNGTNFYQFFPIELIQRSPRFVTQENRRDKWDAPLGSPAHVTKAGGDVFLCWCPTFGGYLGQGTLDKKIDETEKKNNNMFANLHPNLPENVVKMEKLEEIYDYEWTPVDNVDVDIIFQSKPSAQRALFWKHIFFLPCDTLDERINEF
ncbi:hypothetical protein P5673_002961 [Acropora cervicornis]|uniref:Uncharacterized protein n=1 Tax=Acropora cervicornis TaxID=6130 RepID=A0AAD9R2I4_ACRCE|nr:hypothetical protein P5673_002961 [Acropora cervicornis]